MNKSSNPFAAFAVETAEVPQQQQQVKAKPQKPKKIVVKKVNEEGDGEAFEKVAARDQQPRGENRGPRREGNRGGNRGPRPQREGGNREDRPATARQGDGEPRRGGRGGRGRPQNRKQGDVEHKFQGKAREEGHPFDRKDGTGKARRGDKKGGHGKGNWGKNEDEAKAKDEEVVEKKAEEEVKEEKKEETPAVVEPEEEEEEGFTYDDYLAQKQAVELPKAKARGHEQQSNKNVKAKEDEKVYITTQANNLAGRDTYAVQTAAGADLLGFQAPDTYDYDENRGARGGRGPRGRDANARGPREQRPRGGRKGGKIVVNDNEFPAL